MKHGLDLGQAFDMNCWDQNDRVWADAPPLKGEIVPPDSWSSNILRTASSRSNRTIATFIALTFGWTWGFWFLAKLAKADFPSLSAGLRILAGFGPSIVGVGVVAVTCGSAGLRAWFVRCLHWRVGKQWYLFAFLTPLVLMVTAIWLDVALGGVMPAFMQAGKIPIAIANFGLVLLVGGSLGEEFGWRGFLTPALLARMNWRSVSLIVGVIWGIWHLPLFFTAGTPQATMAITVFMLNMLAGSVVFGWLCLRSRGSIVPAIVLHTSLNAWSGILAIIPTATVWRPYVVLRTGYRQRRRFTNEPEELHFVNELLSIRLYRGISPR